MAEAIELSIVTPEKRVISVRVDEVRAPGAVGSFGVRRDHTPFLTAMEPGELVYLAGGQAEYYAVGEGFIEVQANKVTVLAETAEHLEEIDLERARRVHAEAQAKMKGLSPETAAYRLEAAKVKRSAARIGVASRRH